MLSENVILKRPDIWPNPASQIPGATLNFDCRNASISISGGLLMTSTHVIDNSVIHTRENI